MSKENIVDMTKGPIAPQIIHFTLPLIIGNFFVLTYSAADSIIVGRFVGPSALAALGAASPVMNIMLFLIIGICLGMSVLMGNFFGEGNIDKLKSVISTSIITGGVFTLVLVILGFFLSHSILSIMQTPAEIIDDATKYLRIIFIGLIFTFIYNIYACTLRSMGNSKVSLYFLIVSAILNILMDLLFVVVWKQGVEGAAIATVISEAISVIFCVIYVRVKVPFLKFKKNEFVFDRVLLRTIMSYSSVAAMQQITLHLGKFLIQGAVNPLGVVVIAAFNAVTRIDDFVMIVQQNIGHGTTGFLAQNNGKGNSIRIRKGFLVGVKMQFVYTVIAMIIIFIFAKELMALFTGKEEQEVVDEGVKYLRIMSCLYLLPGLTNIIQGYFRGLGKMKITLNATFIQIIVRVISAYLICSYFGIEGFAWACMIGWIFMLAYQFYVFRKLWFKI
ncbi:MATE family efflux transporter [Flavobacterium agrisoli]|uniref:Multidrug-efflux transporter n=1 Tax=Flavobacterium agrisoli TaxID=2793066 RepID=A0A934UJT5_9FLAO|nr:MATE family efflux transporter [Flavobacterium agrisoli]MBK0369843.1 MATE family efflux transporter [Flavobacterium agrisoli]